MYILEPKNATEQFLASLTRSNIKLPQPITRKEKFLKDLKDSLQYYIIDDITKISYCNKQIVSSGNTIGDMTTSSYYILFGEIPLHLKSGSKIILLDNKTYAMQIAYYNSDGSYISGSYTGIGNVPQNVESREINITADCYMRFTIKRRDNTTITNENINEYLRQLKISLILDKKTNIPAAPSIAGTYILTATVDTNGIATYSWVSQT